MMYVKFSSEKEVYELKPGESLGSILLKNYDGKDLIWGREEDINNGIFIPGLFNHLFPSNDPSQPPIKDKK